MHCILRSSVLLTGLVKLASGHGAMSIPRPRNNEANATIALSKSLVRFIKDSDGGIVEQSFSHGAVHEGGCVGPTTDVKFPSDKCSNSNNILTTTRPAATGQLVDCTANDDCTSPSAVSVMGNGPSGMLWLIHYKDSDCSGEPVITYQLNLGACTGFGGVAFTSKTPACEGLSCLWFSEGCGIGCPECTADFSQTCSDTIPPTINDPKLRTYNIHGTDPKGDWTATHPWRAPGSAPVLDACGMAGGSTKNNVAGAGYAPQPGHEMGDKGSQLMPSTKVVWTAGSNVEVAWGVLANHGGGYSYRLCPKSEQLTEECFQRMPLPFASTTQTLRWSNGTQLNIPAALVSVGTVPEGSTWAKNPVPPCSGQNGENCSAPMFPPPPGCDETCWGTHAGPHLLPTIVDELMLPENIHHGDYVLSWRWDCEQTPQIWASCADVVIVGKEQVLV
jgi:hypothetical protein